MRASDNQQVQSKVQKWWVKRREELVRIAKKQGPTFVYDRQTVLTHAESLRQMREVNRLFYAIKANAHAGILKLLEKENLSFECVSLREIEYLREVFKKKWTPQRILFTPNFAPLEEYKRALGWGVGVTVDNLWLLEQHGKLFKKKKIFLRIDPGIGRGHHRHVKTAGIQSKFGIALVDVDRAWASAQRQGIEITGLHAHVGSGILRVETWSDTAEILGRLAARMPTVQVLNLGGGLGVPEKDEHVPLDLLKMDELLRKFKDQNNRFELWIEPGRYLVAEAGVLVARVTQIKSKLGRHYVGLDVGMNSLIRPALYGAYHPIYNLTRWGDAPTQLADVVGPICETGDVLGWDRQLPETQEGDVFLIDTVGAYGRSMSSHYNLREPALEKII